MQSNLDNIKYINLSETRKIGDFILEKDIKLPVLIEDGKDPSELDINSLAAGLIELCTYDKENRNFDYYKKVLLALRPDVLNDLNLAAQAKMKKKDYAFAEKLLVAVKNLAEKPECYINLAVLYAEMTVYYHKKNNDVTADMYDDILMSTLRDCEKLFPDYAPVYNEISAYHLRHGDIESARDYLDKFISISRDAKAKAQAQIMLKKFNDMLGSRDELMFAYDKMMMNLPEDAVEAINRYLSKHDPTWEAFFIRGWAKRVLEEYDSAQKDLLESLRLESKNAETYNELSICARESGNVDLAKSYLEIASDLDEESAVYLTNLAFLHLSDGEFAESREAIERARRIDPEDPQLLYIIKQYEEKTGDKVGEVISEETYSDEDFEELRKKDKEENRRREEL
ncbi:MAG: tetratricopeptide repeat protein [Sphaerochaetaceae bacterium]|nr:tetratricopeptide repeat protein [Sphaerochaetaceae bacterium]